MKEINMNNIINYNELQSKIIDYLEELSIRPSVKGYRYLLRAIELVYLDNDYLNNITKKLYPTIAEDFNTNAQCVDRAMRHAISTAWQRLDNDVIYDVFHYENLQVIKKPSNSEFIAVGVETIRRSRTNHFELNSLI